MKNWQIEVTTKLLIIWLIFDFFCNLKESDICPRKCGKEERSGLNFQSTLNICEHWLILPYSYLEIYYIANKPKSMFAYSILIEWFEKYTIIFVCFKKKYSTYKSIIRYLIRNAKMLKYKLISFKIWYRRTCSSKKIVAQNKETPWFMENRNIIH